MRILELYSGIGGMHYAFKESGITGEIVAAVDINTIANKVYRHNFPKTKLLQRNIQSFSVEEINQYDIDMILMSPPCQPFTRVGLKKDVSDNRTCSFLHILSLFPRLSDKWKYLIVENVKGFEKSEACEHLIHTLEGLDFCYQQLILSPSMFSVPNTRHRYYLIAKRKPLDFIFPVKPLVMENLPFSLHTTCSSTKATYRKIFLINSKHKSLLQECEMNSEGACYSINQVLERNKPVSYLKQFFVPDKVLGKRAWLLDIVGPEATRSCCFTKAYGHYVEGTGSVVCPLSPEVIADSFEKTRLHTPESNEPLEILRTLEMRYFTPREVARLMCFPEQDFNFPSDTTTKQCYRLLGNSINVHVVASLILLMTTGDNSVC